MDYQSIVAMLQGLEAEADALEKIAASFYDCCHESTTKQQAEHYNEEGNRLYKRVFELQRAAQIIEERIPEKYLP